MTLEIITKYEQAAKDIIRISKATGGSGKLINSFTPSWGELCPLRDPPESSDVF